MILDVNGLNDSENMERSECIACGTCVDNCGKSAIRFTFQTPARQTIELQDPTHISLAG